MSFPRQWTEAFPLEAHRQTVIPKETETDVSCTTEVFLWTDKLSPSRRCSLLSRQKILLRGWLTKIWDSSKRQSRSYSSAETVRRQWQFRGTVQTVTATATVKNQKRSHWFICYKSAQWIILAQPSERSNKMKYETGIHKLLLCCLVNTWQY
jgi:hypothetical protein